ncbi:MAG: MATE family efflux transporter [bacterium]|nr:MATE family efflux transporter [bacterium]
MDLLNQNIKSIYRKYLIPSLGSAMVMSIYTMADAIVIGKGVGADALAALSLATPPIALLMSTGILFGVGGSIHMNVHKGMDDMREGRNFFTISTLGIGAVILLLWLLYSTNLPPILRLMGANDTLYPYAHSYMKWITAFLPIVVLSNFLAIWIRNDGNPNLALAGVIGGGCLNIILDIILVMNMDVGIQGAAIASISGMILSGLIMGSHFFSKKNNLRFVKPTRIMSHLATITGSGISSFLNEFSNGLIVCLFNIQVLRYCGQTALAVYGVISNCVILFNSLFTGVGQAIQPIISYNYGAAQSKRIAETKRLGYITIIAMGILFSGVGLLFPYAVSSVFLSLTSEIKEISNIAIRLYFIAFLPAGYSLLSSYYLQSVLKTKESLIVSTMRTVILSSILILTLPLIFSSNVIWLCMPITELVVFVLSFYYVKKNSSITF